MNTIESIKTTIASIESLINSVKNDIEVKQSEINSFEYSIDESDFDDVLDDCEESVNICGIEFYPSDILKSCDPIAYRCAKSDYESNYDLDDCEEYCDLHVELQGLEIDLENLESELDDLETELENLESELDDLETELDNLESE